MDYAKLEEAAGELEDHITLDDLFHFCMVVLGEKPGGLVMSVGREAEQCLEQAVEDLGMHSRVKGDERPGFLARLMGKDRFATRGFFYAREESRFETLEGSDGGFYGCSEEAVGRFLGYPEKAVERYVNADEIGSETIERIKQEFGEMELGYLALVGYIPVPEREQVEKAVEEGKRCSRMLDDLSDEFPRGRELKDRLIRESQWSGS